MRLRLETLAQWSMMMKGNITHDEVKDQLMRCVHRHYKNLTDYGGGVYMDEVKYIMAKSDIESWYSMVGEVPPLIWEALDDKTKELVFEGNDNAVRYAMILTGSLALSIVALYYFVDFAIFILCLYGMLCLAIMFASSFREFCSPWMAMRPPSLKLRLKSSERVKSYISSHSRREPGMLSIASVQQGSGDLTISSKQPGEISQC